MKMASWPGAAVAALCWHGDINNESNGKGTSKSRKGKGRKNLRREAPRGGKKKLVTKYETTGANVHDSQVFDKLVDENDEAILADSAYLCEEAREHLLKCYCQDFI